MFCKLISRDRLIVRRVLTTGCLLGMLCLLGAEVPTFAQGFLSRMIAELECDRGYRLLSAGDARGAIPHFDRAIALTPNAAYPYYVRGNARLRLNELDEAVASLTLALGIDPQCAEAYNDRAVARLRKGELDGGLADINRAIELRPEVADGYATRGLLWTGKADAHAALADFDRAIELNPRHADAYFNRALLNSDRLHNNPAAVADLDKLIEINPSFLNAYLARGLVKMQMGRDSEGMQDFRHVIELRPELKNWIETLLPTSIA